MANLFAHYLYGFGEFGFFNFNLALQMFLLDDFKG